jgi:hypothetical protein
MATITSNGTGGGLWSATATWAGGAVPVDDDTVVIASGDTVTFNVDTSGFANGINGLTITGTLKVSTSTSSYMKMKAATQIAGAGTFNIGESGAGAIPFAVKFTLTGGVGWYVNGTSGMTMTVYGTEPTNKYVTLSGNEAKGQTALSVNTDLTGDIWTAGDLIYISDADGVDNEVRTIEVGGISATEITVTSGLTNAKVSGALVTLKSRNVKIISDGNTIYAIQNFASGKLSIGSAHITVGATGTPRGIKSCVGALIEGGCFDSTGYQLDSCNYTTITGGAFLGAATALYSSAFISVTGGIFSGNTNVFSTVSFTVYISGGLFYSNTNVMNATINSFISGGIFVGNQSVSNSSYGLNVSGGTFTNNRELLYASVLCVLSNITITSTQYTISNLSDFTAYNVTSSGGGTENYNYTSRGVILSQSFDHDGNIGAYKAWTKGGATTSQVSVLPSGYSIAYITNPVSASEYAYWRKTFTVPAGEEVSVEVQLRKDASMTYLPRVYLMNSIENPLVDATAAEDSFTMTDSTNTWESDTFAIDNSAGTTDKDYTLWFVGKNASGNMYSAYDITTASGSGGGLLTHPSMTGGMRG